MDTSRISFGEMIAAASGVALFLFMFFDWFSYKGPGDLETGGLSAWQWMSFLDILLFLVAAVAVAMAVLRATDSMPANLPWPPGMIVAAAGVLAVLIVLLRLIAPGDGPLDELVIDADAGRKIGVWLGLIAAGGIAYGGYTAMNERASGTAPRTRAAPPPPPSESPGSAPPPPEPRV
jgi:Ca2+/H+ antiporter